MPDVSTQKAPSSSPGRGAPSSPGAGSHDRGGRAAAACGLAASPPPVGMPSMRMILASPSKEAGRRVLSASDVSTIEGCTIRSTRVTSASELEAATSTNRVLDSRAPSAESMHKTDFSTKMATVGASEPLSLIHI